MEEKIMVSIICNTYNHELYIRDALQSFVMQKTNFKYEILVHDDASTDDTAKIIHEFEEKYPDLIKPIYRTENRYSQGLSLGQVERAKGKYIALCEGDDYWIDSNKLQKQCDAMEKHTECDICAHSAYLVEGESRKQIGKIAPKTSSGILSPQDVILGGGGFVATSSLMLRSEIMKKPYNFYRNLELDYSLQIAGSLRGGMLFIPDYMSCYRVAINASWTNEIHRNPEKYCRHIDKVINMLKILDEETKGKYKDVISYAITRGEVEQLLEKGAYKKVYYQYGEYVKKQPLKFRIKLRIKIWFPWLNDLNEWRKKWLKILV